MAFIKVLNPDERMTLNMAYLKAEAMLSDALAVIQAERHNIREGRALDTTAPADALYSALLAVRVTQNLRAHVEELAP